MAVREEQAESPSIRLADAAFPEPFAPGVEFNAPARGPWNIVHMGMLLPQSHQIYVCARGCLRGTVLTAAEMGAMDRMSWVGVSEEELAEGRLEENCIEGVTDIVSRMGRRPRAVLLYISCIHLFSGFNYGFVLSELRKRFGDIFFVECVMAPTMRKTLTEEQRTRSALYDRLEALPAKERDSGVNLLGCDFPLGDCELAGLVAKSGRPLRQLAAAKSFDEYLEMAKSELVLSVLPGAEQAGDKLGARLGQRHMKAPFLFSFDAIEAQLDGLALALGLPKQSWEKEREQAQKALRSARSLVGSVPVAIDYTAVSRPLGLARLLLEHGFAVERIYSDAFMAEEKDDFLWLQANAPDALVCSTLHHSGRLCMLRQKLSAPVLPKKKGASLAIGQKAAYFEGTGHFVNVGANFALHGFSGIAKLAAMMEEAARTEKDTRTLIQTKGFGCGRNLL